MRKVLRVRTPRADVVRSRRPFRLLFKSRDGGRKPEISGGPHQSRCLLVRADARSLRLVQRIIIGFVQPLDFGAVEALIPDLKPRAEGFGCAQVLDSVSDGLRRRCEAPIVVAAVLGALCQEQFSGSAVVEGHPQLSMANRLTPHYEVHAPWPCARGA